MNRRKATALCLASLTGGASGENAPPVVAEDALPDPAAAAKWNDHWFLHARAPIGGMHLYRFADPTYVLTKEIGWHPNAGEQLPPVSVPRGFVTDFASIPRLFWSALRPDGEYTFPAIVHDYLYWTQSVPRDVADDILLAGMGDFNISAVIRQTVYRGVQLGGWYAWNSNMERKRKGEQRLLRKLPEDPRITWEDFRKDRSVFAD